MKQVLGLFTAIVLTLSLYAQDLIPYRKETKWGYANPDGKLILPSVYDQAFRFNAKGYARVIDNGNTLLIDKTGKVLTQNNYSAIGDEKDGLIVVCSGGKYNVIQGEIINGKWGYISSVDFKEVIPCTFARAYDFKDGYAIVQENENWGNWGVIDSKGKIILPFKYSTYSFDMRPFPGIQWHWKKHQLQVDISGRGDKWNIIDIKGNKIGGPFQSIHGVESTNAEKDKASIVLKQKEKALEKKLADQNYKIKQGEINYLSNGDLTPINEKLFLAEVFDSTRKTKFGVVDEALNVIIPFQYEQIKTEISENLFVVEKNKLYGFCDMNGKEIIPCIYPYVEKFESGLAKVYLSKNDLSAKSFGYINSKGKQFFEAQPIAQGVKINGKWKITDQYFNEIPNKYGTPSEIINLNHGYLHAKYNDDVIQYDEKLNKSKKETKSFEVLFDNKAVPVSECDKLSSVSEDLVLIEKDKKKSLYNLKTNTFVYNDIKYYEYFNSKGNLQALRFTTNEDKKGIIATNGNWHLKTEYTSIQWMGNYLLVYDVNNLPSIVDTSGKIIYSTQSDASIRPVTGDVYIIQNGNYNEILNLTTKKKTPLQMDTYLNHSANNGSFTFKHKNLTGFYDAINDKIIAPSYKTVVTNYAKEKPVNKECFAFNNGKKTDLYSVSKADFILKGIDQVIFHPYNPVLIARLNTTYAIYNIDGKKLSRDFSKISTLLRKDYFEACENNLCGIIDSTGKIIVPFNYSFVANAFDEFLIANKNGKYGIIDTANNEKIAFSYDDLELVFSSYGEESTNYFFLAEKDGNKGIIDLNNQTHGPFELKGSAEFDFLNDSVFTLTENKKAGLYRFDGKKIIEQNYDFIEPFYFYNATEIEYALIKKGKYYGLIQLDGKIILPCEYEFIDQESEFYNTNEQFVLVKKSGKMGIVNSRGTFTIPCVFNNIFIEFVDDFAFQVTESNGNKGLYKGYNKKLTECIYSDIRFEEELIYQGVIKVKAESKWGLLDTSGKKLTETVYQSIDMMEESDEIFLQVSLNNKYGVIDLKGKSIVPPQFTKVLMEYDLPETMIKVMNGKLFGFYTLKGEEIVPCKMKAMDYNDDGDYPYIFFDNEGKTYRMNNDLKLFGQ